MINKFHYNLTSWREELLCYRMHPKVVKKLNELKRPLTMLDLKDKMIELIINN